MVYISQFRYGRWLLCLFGLASWITLSGQEMDSLATRHLLDSLKNETHARIEQEQIDTALMIIKQAEEICLKTFGATSVLYAELLNVEGRVMLVRGDYHQMEDACNRSQDILKQSVGSTHPAYLFNLLYLLDGAYQAGNYLAAQQTMEEAIPLAENLWGKQSVEVINDRMNLGILYRVNGHLDRAEMELSEVVLMIAESMGRETMFYVNATVNLGLLYIDIGDSRKAEQLYIEAMEVCEQTLQTKEDPTYLAIIQNLGILYWQDQAYEKAEPLFRQSLTLSKALIGEDHLDYAAVLINLGLLYLDMDRNQEAEPLLLEARSVFEDKLQNREHPYYLNGLHNLANVYANTDRLAQAEELNLQVLTIREKRLGKLHQEYAQSLSNLIHLYLRTGEQDKVTPYALDLYANVHHQIRVAFSFLSEREKETFIRTKIADEVALLQTVGMTMFSPVMHDMLYDLVLLIKGLHLRSGISTMEYVLQQQDSSAVRIFSDLLRLRNQLAVQYELPVDERAGIEQMLDEQDRLEKQLARLSATFRQDLSASRVTVQDIRSALKPGEQAIEFIHFPSEDPDKTPHMRYAALILSPQADHVQVVPLFDEEQMEQLLEGHTDRRADYVDALYGMSDRGLSPDEEPHPGLYEMIWQPIMSELSEATTLYVSPAGLLHRLNLGAIALDEERTVSDRYHLQVLSSTRLLASRATEVQVLKNSAMVFGGVYYDFDSTAIDHAVRALGISIEDRQRGSSAVAFPVTRSDRSGRSGWQFLKWTQKEGDKVNTLLTTHGFQSQFSSGFEATEEAFKRIGTETASPTTIHLATHGFFFPDSTPAADSSETKPDMPVNDQPLLRSGILLAGANKAWKEGVQLPGFEDGILTAFEISQLNLTNTELVALSACETGLGDIRGSEGVFGLQRAFKMAGVRYLIMSLWQVPDFQTQDLMTTFYTKWLEEGLPVPEAFQAAQLEMRDKYQSPYFWAGFVLME